MHKNHVRPSNFTLSILVKLLGRSRRLNQAFSMVEETCKRFDLQANIHVYTCLLYACFQNRQLPRLTDLADPNVDVVYLVATPLPEEVRDYYTKLLAVGGVENPATRFRFICPETCRTGSPCRQSRGPRLGIFSATARTDETRSCNRHWPARLADRVRSSRRCCGPSRARQ